LKLLVLDNNPLYGSLEPLKDFRRLEILGIEDTDINSGLEYLPESIEHFKCSADKRKNAKVKVVEEEFKHFNNNVKKLKEFNNSARK
jgi:hypothetical protein